MGFRSRSESARQGQTPRANPHAVRAGTENAGPSGRRGEPRQGRRNQKVGERGTVSRGYQQRRPENKEHPGNGRGQRQGSGDRVRDLVLQVLRDVTQEGAFANLALPKALKQERLTGRDAAFATELTYGTLRALGLLDAVIAKAAGRPVAKIDSMVLDILRLGAYQVLRTRVDDHAAVDTAVNLAKANGEGKASGFVNGVLRTITRTPAEDWLARVAGGDGIADLGLRHAHPGWIAAAFNSALGGNDDAPAPDLESALAADDERPQVHLAARPGQMSGEELALVTGGDEGKFSPYAVYLSEGAPGDIEPVRDRLASVQDEGSQLIALALVRASIGSGEAVDRGRWLDLCAGPGGKTAFIASWAVAEQARVDAIEVAPHRAKLVTSAVENLPVNVHVGDGRKVREIAGLDVPQQGFDRVLVDAPCSGLGALRRRPEARWFKQPDDIPSLVALQKELLTSALEVTAPRGVVIYSTCSPHQAETTDVVRAVADKTGAEILDVREYLPELAATDAAARLSDGARTADPRFVQLWPHRHGTDAMFIAALRPVAGEGN
ncbi:ribosomal RNA small subunit methyltransferase B [Corynebacterium resistens DSM 45100]|uniref:Ribosomal RNA small subunit methyltransferase B n=1 Tax=Corynebacterium resistens (strain DSM 45100 / JCM 12819 / GTC 2026 / SICGH 158) TaxID=662755 RepID=F8E2Y9_CORRG|nr:transcription antitermination factor NusB [Corynebacterium resistens]AEI09449.1 ribosomal RNA small subunit methyltransferase B [Corynebacterium resistens DSM 45100]